MAITHVGSVAVASSAATLPTHQAGDLIVVFSFRQNSDTSPPVLPSEYTLIEQVGDAGVSFTAGWRIAPAPGTTVGGFTNTTRLVATVFRGADPVNPIGFSQTNVGTTNPATLGSRTLVRSSGSWVAVAVGGKGNSSSLGPIAGTSMTARAAYDTTIYRVANWDTNGAVTSAPSITIDTGGASARAALRYEIKEAITTSANTLTASANVSSASVVSNYSEAAPYLEAEIAASSAQGTGAFNAVAEDLGASVEAEATDTVDYSIAVPDLESVVELDTAPTEMHPETGAESLDAGVILSDPTDIQDAVDSVELELETSFETPSDDTGKYEAAEDFSVELDLEAPTDAFGTHMTAEAEPLVLDFGQVSDLLDASGAAKDLSSTASLESQDSLQVEEQAASLDLESVFEDAEIDDSPLNIEMPAGDLTAQVTGEAVQGRFTGVAQAFTVNLKLQFSEAWRSSDVLAIPKLTTVLPVLNVVTTLPNTGTLSVLPAIANIPCSIDNTSTQTAVPTTSGPATQINVPLGVTTVTETGVATSLPSIDIINPLPEE